MEPSGPEWSTNVHAAGVWVREVPRGDGNVLTFVPINSPIDHSLAAWTNPEERFAVAIGLEEAAKNDLILEVWDGDIFGKGDFLGQVQVAGSDREGGVYLGDTERGIAHGAGKAF